MQKLDHLDLIEFGQQLGYPLDSDGLCQGFSGMLMQAILAQEEGQFWKRLKLVEHYKDNFSLLIRKIELVKLKVKKKEEQLSEQDIELLELFAFYDGIKLYLDCDIHQDVFNNRFITHTNLDDIYYLTHPGKLEHYPLRILFDRAYAFNQSGLVNYLNDLAIGVSSYPSLPILAMSCNHSVLLKYNKHHSERPWVYVDTNDFHRYSKLSNYYRELNTEELAHSLFNSLSENSEHIVFNVTLVTNQNPLAFDNSALEQLRRLHPISPEQTVIYDEHGVGLLYLSCLNGHVEAIKQLLIYEDIKINEATYDGATPLYIACQNGHVEIVKLLLARKDIKVNKADECGETPLYIACQYGHVEVIKLLLARKDININEADERGVTPFLIACLNGHTEIIKILLAHKNIEITAMLNGGTSLFIACQDGYTELITILLACKDININAANNYGATPLYISCQEGHIEAIKLLLACKNIKVNEANKNGATPLYIACQEGHIETIKLLLAREDIKINAANEKGVTPFYIACSMGHIEAIKLLLAHKDIDINKAKNNGSTPLYIASQCGDLPIVEMLLQSDNIDVNCVGIEHYTPLLVACFSPSNVNHKLFRLLLNKGANVYHKNDKGETALDIAFMQGNNAGIEEICKYAKKNNLSLKSLMSIDTLNKVQEWAFADSSPSLSDLKLFVQQNLTEDPDVLMSTRSMMVLEEGSAAAALSGMGLFATNACYMDICPEVLSEKEALWLSLWLIFIIACTQIDHWRWCSCFREYAEFYLHNEILIFCSILSCSS
ncbi:ankyrin repeat domain-containing protein [uncultured Legionella sp.]|uniref:ankyrin repeat domain-containing protein n=1 Tax=uncultured Legionella sp. TaxID=210934 RepID=UPI002615AA8A|nr:ankyrin repeat domain-containing protein [uncultured Legionella sp.]